MRRAFVFGVVVLALLAGGVMLVRSGRPPDLRFEESVPDDLRALATETWDEFLAAHDARLDCIAPTTLRAAWELDDRGEYLPASATVVIRVPGTAALLQTTLVHEFAHHVEFTCPDQEALRPAFLTAQDLPASADWFHGESWETTPSEQYAEATVEVVLGRRAHNGNIHITDRATAVVRRWASGS